jgi:hypothetical protein
MCDIPAQVTVQSQLWPVDLNRECDAWLRTFSRAYSKVVMVQ